MSALELPPRASPIDMAVNVDVRVSITGLTAPFSGYGEPLLWMHEHTELPLVCTAMLRLLRSRNSSVHSRGLTHALGMYHLRSRIFAGTQYILIS